MNRMERILKAYDYSDKLTMQNEKYKKKVWEYFANEMHEDLTGFGMWTNKLDVTTSALFSEDVKAKACVKAKSDGVLAGLEEVTDFYESRGVEVEMYKKDGDRVNKGEKVMELSGYAKDLLKLERTGLNILQRMSGIATATKNLKDKLEGYGAVFTVKVMPNTFPFGLASTRKTLDRYLDKRAVTLGGGLSHRLGLYDGILIKDNHLRLIRMEGVENVVKEAIERASKFKNHPKLKFIEIEVDNYKDAIEAAIRYKEMILGMPIVVGRKLPELPWKPTIDTEKIKEAFIKQDQEQIEKTVPCIIMLDNMKPSEIKKVVAKLKKSNLYDFVLLEASGMINEKNIHKYAKAGVDVVSMGCLTHSVKSLDLSQKIVEEDV